MKVINTDFADTFHEISPSNLNDVNWTGSAIYSHRNLIRNLYIITVTSYGVRRRLKITSLTIVCSPVYSGADQRKHQRSASLAFVWEIHPWPVISPHKWPVTRKMFPFDDVIIVFGVINVLADRLASWNARTSAGATMAKFVSTIKNGA